MKRAALVSLALLASPAVAQVSSLPYAARVYQVTALPTCTADRAGRSYGVYDGTDAEDCATGGGSHRHPCFCNGSAWVALARRDEVPDGSGAATQIAFWSDADTLTSASSAIIEAGAAANTLVVDSATRIGMGTAAPAVELHLVRSGAVTSQVESTGASNVFNVNKNTTATWNIGNAGATGFLVFNETSVAGNEITFEKGVAANALYLKSDGKLGLNTSSPALRFHAKAAVDGGTIRAEDTDGTCDGDPESGSFVWTCSSTGNRKKNIREPDIPALVSRLRSIRLRRYETVETDETKTGPVAEENRTVPGLVIERPTQVCGPGIVGGEPVEVCTPGPPELAVVEPSTWELIAAIQWLAAEIERHHPRPPGGPPGPGGKGQH